jgi:glucose/arabinose dehydrogenase
MSALRRGARAVSAACGAFEAPLRAVRVPGAVVAMVMTVLLALAGCERSQLPDLADVGPRPTLLAPPRAAGLPTVHIAPAVGWPANRWPQPAAGLQVEALARDLQHPRWLHVLPNGDVLVAESNAPERATGSGASLRSWVMKLVQQRAGAGVASANRITLLRDVDGDGRVDLRTTFLEHLNSPFGMVLVGDRFYVANTDAVLEYAYRVGQTTLDTPGRKLTDLPAGELNHHWTKALIASPDGRRLYATVGSNSNVAENGIAAEAGRAAIWEIDRSTGSRRLYATGLRNPNGMTWMPDEAGRNASILWTVVNERDELGSDLVPDYLTAVRDGGFYGWPYSWYGAHVDGRVEPTRPDLVAQALVPDYALGAHVAPLGLCDASGSPVAARLTRAAPTTASGVFIGLHGSWNRRPLAGYKVVFVRYANGHPQGLPVDVLTGFVSPEGDAWGRPVGVALDRHGALLVADDVGNAVWRVSAR